MRSSLAVAPVQRFVRRNHPLASRRHRVEFVNVNNDQLILTTIQVAIAFLVWAREPADENDFCGLRSFKSSQACHKVRVWFSFDPRPRVFVAASGIVQDAVLLVEPVDATDANDFVVSSAPVANKVAVADGWQVRKRGQIGARTRHLWHFVRRRAQAGKRRDFYLSGQLVCEPKAGDNESDCNDRNNNEKSFWERSHCISFDAENCRMFRRTVELTRASANTKQ
jgi:hypothetical protein